MSFTYIVFVVSSVPSYELKAQIRFIRIIRLLYSFYSPNQTALFALSIRITKLLYSHNQASLFALFA
jgi:hypothetical protein